MKKIYNILNISIELNATEDVIKYIDENVYSLPLITNDPHSFFITYIKDEYEYLRLKNQITNRETVRLYADEFKEKKVDKDTVYLLDNNSIIIHNNNNNYVIIGASDFAKRHIVYLIREAIYEEYIINNNPILHSAAFADNDSSSILLGHAGSGKTTLLMEILLNSNFNYLSNDLVGCVDKNAMASIIPIRIAYGTLSRFDNNKYADLKEKKTYSLDAFLKEFNLKIKNNVPIKNILFPNYDSSNSFSISNLSVPEAMELVEQQTLNIEDKVRPYLWVNEFDRNMIDELCLKDKLLDLVSNVNLLKVRYGNRMTNDNVQELKRVIKT